MQTDQLAIIVNGVVAILLILLNVWYLRGLTNRTLERQANFTRQTLDHELTLIREKRVQERRSDTYVQMLEMLHWIMEIVYATEPVVEPGPPPPPEPDSDAVRPIQARIVAFASPEVRAIVDERWIPVRNDFFREAAKLRRMREQEKNLTPGTMTVETDKRIASQYTVVHDLRTKLHKIVREIEDRASDELRQ